MKELEKTYNPADIEDRLYQKLPDSFIWDMRWITPCRIS